MGTGEWEIKMFLFIIYSHKGIENRVRMKREVRRN